MKLKVLSNEEKEVQKEGGKNSFSPSGHDPNKYESLALASYSSSGRFVLINLFPLHTQTHIQHHELKHSHFPSVQSLMYQCLH